MANAKNTIQNIPLTGNLNLNKLKTDVASFEGYNDKNTTVFGGELTNIYTKETELGSTIDSYTIFNSKGEPIKIEAPYLKDADGHNIATINYPYNKVPKNIPSDTYWFCELTDGNWKRAQVVLTSEGDLYLRVISESLARDSDSELENTEFTKIKEFGITASNIISINAQMQRYGYNNSSWLGFGFITYLDNSAKLYYFSLYDFRVNSIDINKNYSGIVNLNSEFTNMSFVNVVTSNDYDRMCIEAIPYAGRKTDLHGSGCTVKHVKLTLGNTTPDVTDQLFYHDNMTRTLNSEFAGEPNWEAGVNTHFISLAPTASSQTIITLPAGYRPATSEVTPTCSYNVLRGYYRQTPNIDLSNNTLLYCRGIFSYTGHDGNNFIPGPKSYSTDTKYYIVPTYVDGILLSISVKGRLIESPGIIQTPFYNIEREDNVSYKDANGVWHVYYGENSRHKHDEMDFVLSNIDKILVDKRYISVTKYSRPAFYDIETYKFIYAPISYISTFIPVKRFVKSTDAPLDVTGIVYASGYNVNYPISKNPFVNYSMNSNIMVGFPSNSNTIYFIPTNSASNGYAEFSDLEARDIDVFYSLGDQVQSAKYQGANVSYKDTVYPNYTSNNILYPITWTSKIVNGYSNNDILIDGDTSYPLIYWSPNQKVYAYYALSAMANVKGAFALQGQQYTFDDKNIYNIQFSNGIIQNSTSVCYIENMQYLGTLPTSAIFYSKYNKTFYKFTGDNILTKMFEANDIDEITMVGQNPSTLSLWICTNTGVYVLSDTDMFKLDFLPKDIYFYKEKTILVTEKDFMWHENDISLYDIGNGSIPNPIKFKTKYYGLGGEHKALYDCWYIRLHSDEKREGKVAVKMNTITDTSFASNTETKYIEKSMYDENNQIYLKFQPKYQSGVAVQLELESDIPVYQISLGANVTDQVTQQAKFNF